MIGKPFYESANEILPHFRSTLRSGATMAKSKKVFAVHPGEILKTEFMEPM
jgi:hypothetical protein